MPRKETPLREEGSVFPAEVITFWLQLQQELKKG